MPHAADWVPFRRVSTGAGADSATLYANTVQEGLTPHCVGWIHCINTNANPRYLKLYNKPAPVVGTDVPVLTFEIPGASPGGTGFTLSMTPGTRVQDGSGQATGIGMGLTVGAADGDASAVAAGEVVVNMGFAS